MSDDKVIDLLLKNVRCYLCLEQFDDPRILECHHSFCLSCLEGYFDTFDGPIECPLCEERTDRPKRARHLPKNIFLGVTDDKISAWCSICGEEEEARAYCVECQQNFCRSCIKSHGGITATREHHLVTLDQNQKLGKVHRDLYCKIHTDEKLIYFCVECKKIVCKHCNLTTHKNHDSKHASEVADDLRSNLKSTTENVEHQNYLMWLAERRETFSYEVEKCRKVEKHCVQDIIDRADEIIKMVNEIKTILITKTKNITKDKLQPLKENTKTFEKIISSYSELLLHARNIHSRADDFEIVNSSRDLINAMADIKQRKSIPSLIFGKQPVFKPGKVTIDQLLPFYGDVLLGDNLTNGSSSKKVFEFRVQENSTVLAMIPHEDQRIWVVEGGGHFKLYDSSGKVHQKKKMDIHADDAFETKGHFIISGNSSKKVKVFDKTLKEISSFSFELCCRGIAVGTMDTSIYTCLTEKNAFFDHDPIHKNKIVRIMPEGGRKETPDFLSFAGNPTVEYPARITVLEGGLIAVSDWKQNCITILNKAGYVEHLHLFVGKPDERSKFCPRGICKDNDSNLYVADYDNDRILKLKKPGEFLVEVLNYRDGISKPWSLACGKDGLLWVGGKSGKISTFYFKQPEQTLYTKSKT